MHSWIFLRLLLLLILLMVCVFIPTGGLDNAAFSEEATFPEPSLYGASLAVSVLAGILLAHALRNRYFTQEPLPNTLLMSLLMLLCGILGGRAVFCLVRIGEIVSELEISFLWRFYAGGYAMVGVIAGAQSRGQ